MEFKEIEELIWKIVKIAKNWDYPYCEDELNKITPFGVNAYGVERLPHYYYVIENVVFAPQGDNLILIFPKKDLQKFINHSNDVVGEYYDECLGFEMHIEDAWDFSSMLDYITHEPDNWDLV